MGNIFSGSEVVEIGIQIEKNGQDYYNALAQKTKNAKVKEIFIFLAAEEEKHMAIFRKILEKTQQYEPQGLDADEYYAYMNSLASEHIFTQQNKGKEVAQNINSDKEAVEKGIGFEKDSIVFYEGLKKAVPSYDQKIVEEIIAQERIHFDKLTELKKFI